MKKPDTSLKALYEHLRRFHLSDSLALVGLVNSALKFNNRDFWTDGIPTYVIDWLRINCKNGQDYLTIYTGTTRLARFLILSGANDHRDKCLNINDQSFSIALNMAGDVYERKLEREILPADANSVLARTSQWQFPLQSNQAALIGRAYLLFILLAEEQFSGYSFDGKMREYFDIGAFEFMATGRILWIKTDGVESDLIDILIPDLINVATEKNQRIFLQLSSGTPETYRRAVRGPNWKIITLQLDMYALDPFLGIPAIKIDHSAKYKPGSFVVPQPHYLFDRASNGIFYLLADKEQALAKAAGQKGQNPFRVKFGFVYRAYVSMQLNQSKRNFELVDLDNDFEHATGGKLPDFAIVKDGVCVLFEIKTTLLNIAARSYFEPSVLAEEVKKGVFNKALQQLHDFGETVLARKVTDPRFKDVTRIVKVMVGYDDIFVLNSLILPLINEHYGSMATDLQLASISDIDAMGALVAEGLDLVKMITDKIDDLIKRSYAFIADWEKKATIDNPILKQAFNDFMHRMNGTEV